MPSSTPYTCHRLNPIPIVATFPSKTRSNRTDDNEQFVTGGCHNTQIIATGSCRNKQWVTNGYNNNQDINGNDNMQEIKPKTNTEH
ncbi:hypothetical protein AAF712_015461, partial [Marasmius tenuissimus]